MVPNQLIRGAGGEEEEEAEKGDDDEEGEEGAPKNYKVGSLYQPSTNPDLERPLRQC